MKRLKRSGYGACTRCSWKFLTCFICMCFIGEASDIVMICLFFGMTLSLTAPLSFLIFTLGNFEHILTFNCI